ncbi:MAG: hypothetical protein IPM97_04035 [Bdellovibrionaceae bacterium]|nr:hypothetical protein [Pseudobdellovibrionaceae bacterium]
MKFVLRSLLLAFSLFVFAPTYAQLDSSYELLLGSPGRNSGPQEKAKLGTNESLKKRKPANKAAETNVQTTTPVVLPPPPGIQTPPGPENQGLNEPSFSQQAKSLIESDTERVLDFYVSQFDENDSRNNKVEVSFAPGFLTSEAASNFSYRNYRSVFSAMNLGANVWLTPAIGIGGTFLFSLGADTSGDAVTGTRTPARFEIFDVAVKFRNFFGFSRLSKSVEFDVLYTDYKITVPADDIYRARLKTSGLGVKMALRVPYSHDVAWVIGGSFFPRLQHTEEKTGLDIKSGNNVENTRIGVQVGNEVSLSRQAQIFYEASVSSEKNLFDGSAGIVDPATGATPKNVSVTNTLYMFSLGYRWGN